MVIEKMVENNELSEYITAVLKQLQIGKRNSDIEHFFKSMTIDRHIQILMRLGQLQTAVELLHRIIYAFDIEGNSLIADKFKSVAKINMAEILLLGTVYFHEDESPLAVNDIWLTENNFYYLRMIQAKYVLMNVTCKQSLVIKSKIDKILSQPTILQKAVKYYSDYVEFKLRPTITSKICEIRINNSQSEQISFQNSLSFWKNQSTSVGLPHNNPVLSKKSTNILTFWKNQQSNADVGEPTATQQTRGKSSTPPIHPS